jgi:hypothetical protein
MKAAMHRHEVGARRYFEKFFGPTGFRVWLAARARAQTLADDAACPYPLTEVPPSFSPPSVDVPEHQGAFLEVAGNPKFSLAVGIFPPGPGSFRVPETFWNQLPLTHYWCRAVDPATGGTLRAWRLTRCPET